MISGEIFSVSGSEVRMYTYNYVHTYISRYAYKYKYLCANPGEAGTHERYRYVHWICTLHGYKRKEYIFYFWRKQKYAAIRVINTTLP